MKHKIYILVILLIPTFFLGQDLSDNIRAIDSLRNEIKKTSNTEEIRILYEDIISLQYSTDIDGILESTNALKKLNTNGDCEKCLAISFLYEAMHYYLKGDLEKAALIYEKASKEGNKVKERYVSNKSLTMLSAIYFYKNDYSKAKAYADLLVDNELESDSITSGLYDGYFMKGLINDDQSYFGLAIKNYIKADSVNNLLKTSNFKINQSKLYNNLAIVFIQKKDFEKASFYLNHIYDYYVSENNSEGIYSTKQNLGYLEVEKGNYSKAIEILNETVSYYKEIKNVRLESEANNQLGKAYFGIKKYKKAISYLESSLHSFEESGALVDTGVNYSYIGKSYLALGDLKESEKNLNKALTIFNNVNSHGNQLNTLRSFVKLNKAKKNFKEALHNHKQIDSITEIFLSKQNENQLFELETKYQTEKKEQEIALLTTQNKLSEKQKSNQKILFGAGIAITSLAALFFFFQYRNRQKTNKKLRELDAAKSTFFTNISHDFRTPLTLIKGPLEDQLEDQNLSLSKRKNLNAAYKNTERLENLVSQLMSLAKLNSSAMPLKVQPININAFLETHTQGFQYQSEEQGLQFSLSTQEADSETWLDLDILEKILYNLLGNALKYTSENGQIKVDGVANNKELKLQVYNDAIALSAEEKEKLFNRFYQTDAANKGTGIGLSLVKQLTKLHKGNISVENNGEGIAFTVKIPTHKPAYETHEILSEELYATNFDSGKATEEDPQLIAIENDAPVLLVVDDSKEIREYIQSIFQDSYKILLAANGKQGCTLAITHIPDIIVSDVVMPIMDGYTLTKKVKEDPITSHIPIILLTAKNKEVDELQAKNLGADLYTTKPFSPKLLKANVENLIENRRKLQQRFTQEVLLTPKEIAVTTAEEEFLNRLQEVLEAHLTQPDFTAAKFSEVMVMNRMQLHRKLKALTGLSSSEFIKNQRLKIAAQLISSKDLNISEVAYNTGFNDPSYFAKCFKQEYGVSPKEFAQKDKNSPS